MRDDEDPITTPPTLTGQSVVVSGGGSVGQGRAWLLDRQAIYASRGTPNDFRAEVATWLIEAPWAHPFWHSYVLSVIHLRPMEGLAAPKLYLPDATHEMVLYALDANHPRQPMIDGGDMHTLRPVNFAAQIVAASDGAAAELIGQTVQMICDGRLSPDTDFRAQWIALFNDSMVRRG